MKNKLNRIAFFLFLFGIAAVSQAQIPTGYYDNAEGKTGTELKTALHNIIKGHTVVSYSGLLDAFAYTDCYSDGKIWDIYSNYHWSLTSNCGSYSSEGDCWNREHSWPQSWFNEKAGPKSDLFHIYPTDGFVNGKRSNYPYGEVNKPTYTSGNGSKLGPCATSGYSGTVFEPIDEYKGDIARGFFYMSVRYYGEDSGWSTSGMTNKSVILDWAMTMLLRWSDNDPVSEKEIARNNAIYGYQGNRNPFIDHPEYARMIWDPNYTATTSYTITCATGLSHGSVSAPTSASEGTTVSITATPDAGYMVSGYTVYKTGDTSTTVTVSSNGTFTMPAYNVTVSATFTQNNTYYAITTGTVSHGSISVSANSARSGSTITMTATPDEGYSLYSWYVYKTGNTNTNVYSGTNGSFTMPAFNVTVTASFSTQGSSSSNGDFVKVTSAPDDWSGEYLIVYEGGNVAFDGGLTTLDATNNTISVTINNNTIEATQTTIAAKFTIEKTSDNYTIKSSSGNYIGNTDNSNALSSSPTTVYTNSLSYNEGNVDIVSSGGAYLRFNNNSGQNRFRYYKSTSYSSQQAIQLYRRAATVETPTHTIHFYPNGATGDSYEQTVEEYVPSALLNNTFTREGYEFDGWNTLANGEGTYYADNATVTLTADLDLYAQWNPKYNITLTQPENGTISASATSALAETTIILTATPASGYEFEAWTVTTDGGLSVEVVEDQFEMPADHVNITANFSVQSITYDDQYVKVTAAPTDWSGQYLIVYEDGNVAFNGGLSSLDVASNTITVSISDNTIPITTTTEAAEFTIEKTGDNYTIKSSSGNYIGNNNDSNALSSSPTTVYTNSLTYNGGNVDIVSSGGAYLRFNSTSSQNRFRYFKSSTYTSQKAIQLYKRTGGEVVIDTYTITYYPNGGTGESYTQTVNEDTYTTLEANTFSYEGYLFNGWNTQADGTGTAYDDQQEVSLNADLDLYAQWTLQEEGDDPEPNTNNFYLVTSTEQLIAGRNYLIVNIEAKKALSKTQNNNNRASADITLDGDTITNVGDACVLTLGGQAGAWTLYDSDYNDEGGYLYAASSSANQLKTQTTNDNNGCWAISINDNGVASLQAQGTNTRNLIRYNASNNPPIFSCYASGQKDVALFIQGEVYDHTQDETIANIFYFDKHIVSDGATLTVTGTATSINSSMLILEDGAKLVHHNDGVKATVKKDIEAYSGDGGWFTIAMPFTSYTPSETMVSDDFDLYYYDEDGDSEGKEWINYKAGSFDLTAGQGYLYAHNPGLTIEAKGTLNNGDYNETIDLAYGNSGVSLRGYNLLGNPTAHDISFAKSGDVADGYYYLDKGETWVYENSNTVPAGRGFLVKANATGQTVTLNPQSKRGDVATTRHDAAQLLIDVDGEKAYVKLTEGVSMPLLGFRGHHSNVYLTRDDNAYVMLVRDNAESIDLNYQPQHFGQHTISVALDDTSLAYLHLIDRLTGTDIDLLQTPSYRFESRESDYASRFALVFNGNGDSRESFAYISDGQLIINGEGILQIFDVLGHQLFTKELPTANCQLPTVAGVYMLRLIQGDNVKTQKIVIH